MRSLGKRKKVENANSLMCKAGKNCFLSLPSLHSGTRGLIAIYSVIFQKAGKEERRRGIPTIRYPIERRERGVGVQKCSLSKEGGGKEAIQVFFAMKNGGSPSLLLFPNFAMT